LGREETIEPSPAIEEPNNEEGIHHELNESLEQNNGNSSVGESEEHHESDEHTP
jgi:hypothetical protein